MFTKNTTGTDGEQMGDIEDPKMLEYVEDELLRRRGLDPKVVRAERAAAAKPKEQTETEELFKAPDVLKGHEPSRVEDADAWMTGVVEVSLPTEYRLANIEENERMKKQMLDKQHRKGPSGPVSGGVKANPNFYGGQWRTAQGVPENHPAAPKGLGGEDEDAPAATGGSTADDGSMLQAIKNAAARQASMNPVKRKGRFEGEDADMEMLRNFKRREYQRWR